MQPYRAMLVRRGVEQSMSRKGNCFDNAAIESFCGTLKAEYFYLERPDSIDALEAGMHDYIHYYHYERIKLRAGAQSGCVPAEKHRQIGGIMTVHFRGQFKTRAIHSRTSHPQQQLKEFAGMRQVAAAEFHDDTIGKSGLHLPHGFRLRRRSFDVNR
jgi:hypothetical protein